MPEPTTSPDTKIGTETPVKSDPAPMSDPERHYMPERLCPSQTQDGGWRAKP